MATILDSTLNLIDTAIGPVGVKEDTLVNFDIDDFVHNTVRSQAIFLQLLNKIRTADSELAENRFPVSLGGESVGGFKI